MFKNFKQFLIRGKGSNKKQQLFDRKRNIYLYFDAMVGLTWSKDSESYVGSIVINGRVSHARYVKGDDPAYKGYFRPPCLGFSMGIKSPTNETIVYW